MSTLSLLTSLLTEDCSRFLPSQHRTLDHRLFEDVSVAQQDPLISGVNLMGSLGDDDSACGPKFESIIHIIGHDKTSDTVEDNLY